MAIYNTNSQVICSENAKLRKGRKAIRYPNVPLCVLTVCFPPFIIRAPINVEASKCIWLNVGGITRVPHVSIRMAHLE